MNKTQRKISCFVGLLFSLLALTACSDLLSRLRDFVPIDYTIIYELGGGENNPDNPNKYTVEDGNIILKEPKKDDAVFEGWYTNDLFDGEAIASIVKGTVGDITFWAKWKHDKLAGLLYTDFTYVPGGEFRQQEDDDENFAHKISSFDIGQYQVTYELWYTVKEWAESGDRGDKKYDFAYQGAEGKGSVGTDPSEEPNKYKPVTTISWREAIAWCNAYSEMSGLKPCYYLDGEIYRGYDDISGYHKEEYVSKIDDAFKCSWNANGYRLPSEGEWEYAARYIDGDAWQDPDWYSGVPEGETGFGDYMWYKENAYTLGPQPVGQKESNALDIYDMQGNTWELCWDWFDLYPPKTGAAEIDYRGAEGPYNDGDVVLPKHYNTRIIRGGSYVDDPTAAGARVLWRPGKAYQTVGFRLAKRAK